MFLGLTGEENHEYILSSPEPQCNEKCIDGTINALFLQIKDLLLYRCLKKDFLGFFEYTYFQHLVHWNNPKL